jgi:isocitrate dehydrogenase kinase/phosphatase
MAKQGKTLFYRDFLHHLRHSSDKFRIAPGIKGMVMLVFDLPSFPMCSRSSKTITRRKKTPRASRSRASICWSSSTTGSGAWPIRWSTARWRFRVSVLTDELIAEIEKFAPSQLEISDRDGDGKHGSHHQTRLHRAAHDSAQHLSARGL